MDRKTQTQRKALAFIIGMMFVTIACNLGSTNNAPPTLVPRDTLGTPQPTIGFAPPPVGATVLPGATPIARAEIELFQLLNQVDSSRLMSHVTTLENFHTRHVNSVRISNSGMGINAAANYIRSQFEIIRQDSNGALYTFDQEFQMIYDEVSSTQRNIVAVIQGTEVGAGTIVIGAHYDSVGFPFDDPEAFAPGANDNATGVAAVIELARLMSQSPHRATIMFVAFSAEEVDRKGSIAFARWLRDQNVDLIGMINLDTLGNHNDRDGNINNREIRVYSSGPNETSRSRHFARTVNFLSFNQSLSIEFVIQDGIDRENRYGDHFSFEEQGYPSIRFIQALEEKRNADPTDTVQFIEADYFTRSVQTILGIMTSLADAPRPPTNVSFRKQGNGMTTLIWEQVPDAASYIVALRLPGSLEYDQQFEVTDFSVDWDKFDRYQGIAIASKDANGLIGPLSQEFNPR